MKELKRAKPALVIGVGGCVASQEGAAITKRAPYVDVVFGPQTLHRLPQLIAARRASGVPQVDIRFPEIEKFDHLPPATVDCAVDGPTAFVSIMEGCSKYCSFCVVPYTRGEEVLARLRRRADGGRRPRGAGRAKKSRCSGRTSTRIARRCRMPGTRRPRSTRASRTSRRCSSTSPTSPASSASATRRRIRRNSRSGSSTRMPGIPKLVSQLHLPVQSGSDRILMAMKRGYTTLEYKSIVRRLRAVRPDLSLSTDIIVGFPGETDADFDGHDEADRRRRLRRRVSRSSTARGPARRRRRCPTTSTPKTKLAQARSACRPRPTASRVADQPSRWWVRASASLSKARRARTSDRALWAVPTTIASSTSCRRIRCAVAGRRFRSTSTSRSRYPHSLRGSLVARSRDARRSPPEGTRPSITSPTSTTHASRTSAGVLDENLRQIEAAFDVTIKRRGARFTIGGSAGR